MISSGEKQDIRVLLVDDHEMIRRGLRRVLEAEEYIDVVGDCASAEEAFSKIEMLSPHVVLMDVRMPGMNGIEATRKLKATYPAIKVIMLTMYEEHTAESIAAGADAYVLKDARCSELTKVIREVYTGRTPWEQSEICVDHLSIFILPPAGGEQIMSFIARLGQVMGAKVEMTIGDKTLGTIIRVCIEPAPPRVHLGKLREMVEVANAEEKHAEELGAMGAFLNSSATQLNPRGNSVKGVVVTLK
jgi:CheY-like chemotaxis protein